MLKWGTGARNKARDTGAARGTRPETQGQLELTTVYNRGRDKRYVELMVAAGTVIDAIACVEGTEAVT